MLIQWAAAKQSVSYLLYRSSSYVIGGGTHAFDCLPFAYRHRVSITVVISQTIVVGRTERAHNENVL